MTVDLIICDKNLPDGEGYQFVDFFKRTGCKTPIIMLSGDGDVEVKLKGFSLGVKDYLTKPMDMRELRHRIKQALNVA